jgi:hypothetical protein
MMKVVLWVTLDFSLGTIGVSRVKNGTKVGEVFARKSLLEVTKTKHPLELFLQFGPPLPAKKTLTFESSQQRDEFSTLLREAFPLPKPGDSTDRRGTPRRAAFHPAFLTPSIPTSTSVTPTRSRSSANIANTPSKLARPLPPSPFTPRTPRVGTPAPSSLHASSPVVPASLGVSMDEPASFDPTCLPPTSGLLIGLPPHRRTLQIRPLEQKLHAVIIMCCNIIGWLPPPNRSNPFKNTTLQESAFKLLLTVLSVVGAHRSATLSSRASFVQVL